MSFPRYPKYKPSGVEWLGEVPEGWEVRPVGSVATIVNGFPFDSSAFDPDHGVPLVRIRDLGRSETECRFNGAGVDRAEITNRDVLIGMDGDFNVGRWLGSGIAYLNQRMCCVRGDSEAITRLLEYALPFPLRMINDVTYATTVKHLSSKQVEKIRVPVPPLPEQRAIAAFLDRETGKIDALVAEQERLIELLKEKRQAVISHAVTKGLNPKAPMKDSGIEWLGEVPAHWKVTQCRRLARPGTSITYGIVQAGPHCEDGVPYIRTSDMSGAYLREGEYLRTTKEIDASYARSRVRAGDLVVAIRASVGKALLVPEFLDGANLTQGTAKISPCESVISEFLLLAFNSGYCQESVSRIAKGSTFLEITLDGLRRIEVVLPPLAEQHAIVAHLDRETSRIDALLTEAQRAIELLQERRSALISAAVTGQIDVRKLGERAA